MNTGHANTINLRQHTLKNGIRYVTADRIDVGLLDAPENICCVDSNGDGKVDIVDAGLASRYYASLDNTVNVGKMCNEFS